MIEIVLFVPRACAFANCWTTNGVFLVATNPMGWSIERLLLDTASNKSCDGVKQRTPLGCLHAQGSAG